MIYILTCYVVSTATTVTAFKCLFRYENADTFSHLFSLRLPSPHRATWWRTNVRAYFWIAWHLVK